MAPRARATSLTVVGTGRGVSLEATTTVTIAPSKPMGRNRYVSFVGRITLEFPYSEFGIVTSSLAYRESGGKP